MGLYVTVGCPFYLLNSLPLSRTPCVEHSWDYDMDLVTHTI